MDHGAVTQDREVEAVAVEGDELGVQLGNLADKGRDQLPLGSLPYMWGSQGINRPVIILAVSDKRTDAYDRMIDMLRKLVTNRCPNLLVCLSSQAIGSGKAAEVGYGLKVPDDDACVHRRPLHKLVTGLIYWRPLLRRCERRSRLIPNMATP